MEMMIANGLWFVKEFVASAAFIPQAAFSIQTVDSTNTSIYNKSMRKIYQSHRKTLVAALSFSLILSLLQVFDAFVFQRMVDAIVALDLRTAILTIFVTIAVIVCVILSLALKRRAANKYVEDVLEDTRYALFARYIGAPYAAYFDRGVGDYINTIGPLCNELQTQYIRPILNITTLVLQSVLALLAVFLYSPIMGLLILFLMGLEMLIPLLRKKVISENSQGFVESSATFLNKSENLLNGFELIASQNIQPSILRIFRSFSGGFAQSRFQMNNAKSISDCVVYLAHRLIIIVPWFVGAWLVSEGRLTFGMLMAISQLNNLVTEPMSDAFQNMNELLSGRKIAAKIRGDIAAEERPPAPPLALAEPFASLELRNIRYARQSREILKDINCTIEAGKKYLVIGGSGAGKSTLLKVACGLLTDFEGELRVNGHTVDPARCSLANVIGFNPQDVYLFSDTLRNNITLYRDFPGDAIQDTVNRLGMRGFVSALDHGLDTPVGSTGQFASGGEKQRIGLARLLMNKTPVIALDESTSALDVRLYYDIENLILSLTDVTILSVTHRLEEPILRRYDRILVMRDGEIVGTGTFDELMAHSDEFRRMVAER